ncbi:hypothetical protein GGX14DRAFT_555680 [Mycena pura]|uniref:Uncharacterized protein n=1 Tax=Mycena pura TaxID=153505 RepID=A0AAD6YS47_9AGAR|nr:hypothetical protein GGX14DRAFT_555680 [Mycena pura]
MNRPGDRLGPLYLSPSPAALRGSRPMRERSATVLRLRSVCSANGLCPRPEHAAVDEPIPRPPNASKIRMEDLQEKLGADSLEWNAMHTVVRDALSSAQLNPGRNWKAQNPSKLARALLHLSLTTHLTLWAWSNRKSYQSWLSATHALSLRATPSRRWRSPLTARHSQGPPDHVIGSVPNVLTTRTLTRTTASCTYFPNSQDEDVKGEEEPEMSSAEGKKCAAPQDGSSNKRCLN